MRMGRTLPALAEHHGCSRISIYRRHKRLIAALDSLLRNRLITRKEYQEHKRKVDAMYERWRKEWKRTQPKNPRSRGRPMPPDDRRNYKTCKCGCGKPPAPGQAYASRECAPLSNYGLERAA